MKSIAFVLIYGLVVGCIGFTITTLFGLSPYLIGVLTIPAVALANRVGAGFGVRILPARMER
ncbi:hypothetical protein D9V34_14020 [Mycetocola lacteus]|uniref:Uncharacterized protein n=1 Tax=Mycetocola lacteus TaxID=76637 RepID=A0A3L7AL69_9MICO|nr:hypothetical protein [Mycetocola lacteus]RLP80308.1 hypothetical protein D9V34_14020 [Mycetocola lacteus]